MKKLLFIFMFMIYLQIYAVDVHYAGHSDAVQFGISKIINLPDIAEIDITVYDSRAAFPDHYEDSKFEIGAFRIIRTSSDFVVLSHDETGAMYGLLDIAETAMNSGWQAVQDKSVVPHLPFRAIKFNLPWSTYRRHESLSQHYETVRDLDFWSEFLDMMASNRFNVLTLWNLHPFPYMIRTVNYPNACPFSEKELADWQSFWHELFTMSKNRGIDTYLVNWNIFASPTFAEKYDAANYEGKYYYGEGDTSDILKKYNRECITQVMNAYPNLTGLGTSMGERMVGMSPASRQKWIEDVYFAGIKAADRDIQFIHRIPFSTSREDIMVTKKSIEESGLPSPIWTPLKFNWSHGHSTPELQIAHGGDAGNLYWSPKPDNYKMIWTVRNEDFFMLNWGDPDFIRDHIRTNSHDYVGGYIIGSETYIPAKEYTLKKDITEWKYAFQKQWLFYALWGRLLFDPNMPDSVFEKMLDCRYDLGVNANDFLKAMKLGSRYPLKLASFYRASWDFTLYSEGFLASAKSFGPFDGNPFISILELIEHQTLDTNLINIEEYVSRQNESASIPDSKITPLELADDLQSNAEMSHKLINQLGHDALSIGSALNYELNDIKIWSHLSMYFAYKLRAGVEYETHRKYGGWEHRNAAIEHLENAITHWKKLSEITDSLYQDVPLVHLPHQKFHWSNFLEDTKRDLIIVKGEVESW